MISILPKYSVGVYRSKDPIKNIRIKVKLNRASEGVFKSQIEGAEDAKKDPTQLKELKKLEKALIANEQSSFDEEVIIQWQTKIFSKREFKDYSSDAFMTTSALEKSYSDDCKKLKEKGHVPGHIFTYIDADMFEFSDEARQDISQPDAVLPPYLEKTISNLRKRKPLIGNKQPNVSVPHVNIVDYNPNPEEKRSTSTTQYHTMYIMADLAPRENMFAPKLYEKVLCCIKMDRSGTLIVKPDFNNPRRPHNVEAGGIAYEYIIENVSEKITTDDILRENRIYKELYLRHINFVKNLVGTEFSLPAPNVLNVHLFGEILCARNFDYDDIHVYYQLELPKNWYMDPSQQTSGFTVTSRTICDGPDEVAYFSHPFEFQLFYINDEINENNRDELPKMPKIYFEVASYDSWSRYRVEGYSWTQIPTRPGVVNEKLQCWRPRGDSFIYEMRRFFIGGSPELEDISYVAVPSDHEGKLLSRFGFRTTTTGQLEIKMNTLYQSQIFMDKKMRKKQHVNLLEKIGSQNKINEIMTVLDAFNQSKQRMIMARENSKKVLDDE